MNQQCEFCGAQSVAELTYEDRVSAGRKRLSLTGLLKMECSVCGMEFVTEAQMAHNHELFDAALSGVPESITVGDLRGLRGQWDLTQRSASSLFGAGESAFAKWESGQLPSGPTSLLLQCAIHVSGVMEYLAALQKATLPGCPELTTWHSASGESTGVLPAYLPRKQHAGSPARSLPVRAGHYKPDVVQLYGKVANA